MSDDRDTQAEKKIIIDEDWKAQAQAEKEQATAEKSDEPKHRPPLPPANISFLFSTLATQAILSMGLAPNPVSEKIEADLEQAKHFIDMLAVLEDKTKGNLTDDERRTLESVLYDLRMGYVELSSRHKNE